MLSGPSSGSSLENSIPGNTGVPLEILHLVFAEATLRLGAHRVFRRRQRDRQVGRRHSNLVVELEEHRKGRFLSVAAQETCIRAKQILQTKTMKVDPNARMTTLFNRIAYLFIDSRKSNSRN